MVVAIILAMVVLQVLIRLFALGSTNAGLQRGDILLDKEVLPNIVAGWTVTGFRKPDGKGDVAGIIGWSHSWDFESSGNAALVSFDQIGFFGWHELTLCYEATGWIVTNRFIKADQAAGWHCVVADMSNTSGAKALMLYSIFDGTGVAKKPPEMSGYVQGGSLTAEQKRCLQCQVMMPYDGTYSELQLELACNLHFVTRELFRQEWLRQLDAKSR